MDLGGVFGGAWALYKRNLGTLIVAGIIAGVVSGIVTVVAVIIGAAIGLGAMRGFVGHGALSGASPVGFLGGLFVAIAIGVLIAQLVVLVLEGGMLKMAVDSGRSGRVAQLGELFAGFARLPAYLAIGLIVQFAVPGACLLVVLVAARLAGPLGLLVGLVCVVVMIWLYTGWLYGLPLIADRGLGPIAALRESRQMVSRAGWWGTFALLFVLGFAAWAIMFVLSVAGRTSGLGQLLALAGEICLMPYVICYVAYMCLGSESTQATPVYGAPPSGSGYGPYGAWPSPAAPFDPTTGLYPAPAAVAGAYRPPPAAGPARPDVTGEGAAWARAADPLAGVVPVPAGPPVVPPHASGEPDPTRLSG